MYKSSEPSGFSFAFHELEHITDSDWTLHVSDEVTFVSLLSWNEDDLDLGDTSSWSSSAQKLSDSSLDRFDFHVVIIISN